MMNQTKQLNKLCKNFVDIINNNFGDIVVSIIFYGSNIYIQNTSDLDVCIIIKNYNKEIEKKFIDLTISFHLQNSLKIDNEISFNNKLLYTIDEIEEVLLNHPFYKNGQIIIRDVVKTKEFLESKEMKQRLLLNILTTDHITVGKSTIDYEKKAMIIMINVICKYYNLINPKVDEVLNLLYENPYTKNNGDMYLGYKDNHPNKKVYLKERVEEVISKKEF